VKLWRPGGFCESAESMPTGAVTMQVKSRQEEGSQHAQGAMEKSCLVDTMT
jgi:hypothetical protein